MEEELKGLLILVGGMAGAGAVFGAWGAITALVLIVGLGVIYGGD